MAGTVLFEKNDNIGPSPGLWHRMPRDVWYDPAVAFTVKEDFERLPVTGDRWTLVEGDATADITQLLTEIGGVTNIQVDTTDNIESYIGGANGWGMIDSDQRPLAWEARFRLDAIADHGFYIGLTEEATAAANMLVDDTGEMVVKDAVGFHALTATPATLSSIHITQGGAKVIVGTALTIVASTWYKVGCYFDGKRTFWFVDGVIVAPTAGVLTGATNFPNGEELTLSAGVKVGAAAAVNLDLDWAYFAQLRA